MAEFSEVMSQFMRLCDNFEDCDNCPVFQEGFSCESDHQGFSKTGAEELEAIIMKWAAEHPEPVYPTWAEWLNSIGVTISDQPFPAPNIPVYVYQAGAKMFEPIPADIAQKLEIEPKPQV